MIKKTESQIRLPGNGKWAGIFRRISPASRVNQFLFNIKNMRLNKLGALIPRRGYNALSGTQPNAMVLDGVISKGYDLRGNEYLRFICGLGTKIFVSDDITTPSFTANTSQDAYSGTRYTFISLGLVTYAIKSKPATETGYGSDFENNRVVLMSASNSIDSDNTRRLAILSESDPQASQFIMYLFYVVEELNTGGLQNFTFRSAYLLNDSDINNNFRESSTFEYQLTFGSMTPNVKAYHLFATVINASNSENTLDLNLLGGALGSKVRPNLRFIKSSDINTFSLNAYEINTGSTFITLHPITIEDFYANKGQSTSVLYNPPTAKSSLYLNNRLFYANVILEREQPQDIKYYPMVKYKSSPSSEILDCYTDRGTDPGAVWNPDYIFGIAFLFQDGRESEMITVSIPKDTLRSNSSPANNDSVSALMLPYYNSSDVVGLSLYGSKLVRVRTVVNTTDSEIFAASVFQFTAFEEEDPVILQGDTGTEATGITFDTTYYVKDLTANSMKLSLTPGGSAISITTDFGFSGYGVYIMADESALTYNVMYKIGDAIPDTVKTSVVLVDVANGLDFTSPLNSYHVNSLSKTRRSDNSDDEAYYFYEFKNSIIWSDINIPTSIPSANREDFGLPSEGIVGVFGYDNTLYVYKETEIWLAKLTGNTYPIAWKKKISDTFGCLDKDSIIEVKGVVYHLAQNSFCATYGDRVQEIGQNELDDLLSECLATGFVSCKSIYNDNENEIWFSIVNTNVANNGRTFIYDLDSKGWTYYDYARATLDKYPDTSIISQSYSATPKTYNEDILLNKDTDGSNTAISWQIDTGFLAQQDPLSEKMTRYISAQATDVTIVLSLDKEGDEGDNSGQSITKTATGKKRLDFKFPMDGSIKTRFPKVRITGSTSTSSTDESEITEIEYRYLERKQVGKS